MSGNSTAVAPAAVAVRPPAASGGWFSPNLTASLNLARALAAIYVVFHHLALRQGFSSGPGIVFRFGQEAVIVFFLLSGVVIFANERQRALRPRGYFIRRLRRIYPALLVALVVSTAVHLDNGDFNRSFRLSEFAATLVSLQDVGMLKPGVIANPYLGNDPLWSLSYEVVFYLAFPLVLRAWVRRPNVTNHAVGLVCCLAYLGYVLHPDHWLLVASYFLIWWNGAMAADAYFSGHRSVMGMKVPFLWLIALTVMACAVTVIRGHRGFVEYPALMARHFAGAALFLVILFGPVGRRLVALGAHVAKPAAYAASLSYGIYVLHHPILIEWDRTATFAGVLMGMAAVFATSYFADRYLHKHLPRAPED